MQHSQVFRMKVQKYIPIPLKVLNSIYYQEGIFKYTYLFPY